MKNIHFDQKVFSNMEFPLQKLMELNIKTMQGFSYMKPGELFSIKKPEELLERNMNMFIRNSHMALDYMRDTFSILENHWIKTSHLTEEAAKDVIKKASSTVKQASSIAKKASSTASKAAKKPAKPAAKKTAAHTKSAAKPSTKTVAKASDKKSVKKAAKPVVQHSKSTMPHTSPVMKQEPRVADEKAKQHQAENKDGHSPAKVSPMHDKGLGLLNKGRNFPN
jgi:ABC-type proline/glycine betaine transport system ATPase subunit